MLLHWAELTEPEPTAQMSAETQPGWKMIVLEDDPEHEVRIEDPDRFLGHPDVSWQWYQHQRGTWALFHYR